VTNHIPDYDTVREFFIDGAEGQFIGEDFDTWLKHTLVDAQLVAVRDSALGIEASFDEQPTLKYLVNNDRGAKIVLDVILEMMRAAAEVIEFEEKL
jgi:hypothetical protein